MIIASPEVNTMSAFSAKVSGAQPAKLQRTNFAGTTAETSTVDPASEAVAEFTETMPEDPTITYNSQPQTDTTTVSVAKDYGKRWTLVGQWFSNATAVTGDFQYTSGASSELGVGVSASGDYGSFSSGSTQSQGWSVGLGFPTSTGVGDLYYRTRFHYKLFLYHTCVNGWTCSSRYKAEPTALEGGEDIVHPVQAPGGMHDCNPYPKDSNVFINYSRAINWTNGVNIGGAIGIDLSSRTGYSSASQLAIHFNADRRLCGRGPIGTNPYVLAARPRL